MKSFFRFILIYLVIGFFYNMVVEYQSFATKLRRWNENVPTKHILSQLLYDPSVYAKSIIYSPFWLPDLYLDFYNRSRK